MLQMNQKRRKKITFERAGSCGKTGRGDKGVLTDSADFGIDVFPKVQVIILESLQDD